MKIIGLDLGTKTLGVAISDALGIIANPIGTYRIEEKNLNQALEFVKDLIKEHGIIEIVLGFPKNMDGSTGFQCDYISEFKEILEKETGLKVFLIDERLTSVIANRTMLSADMSRQKRKKNVDKLAASIILQGYLDSNKFKKGF
ncbi:MAG: Holliday junction resolvase RuvX [Bacilli bacterium]|nr:Holliday junction resolvase RuvX [Bacilli bacterium]MDD3382648.1 Holliday junction resolvase RuvX [Bacilli bacterium]